MTTVLLCNVPELSNNYKDSFDFYSLNNQLNYFSSKVVYTLDLNKAIDSKNNTLTVPKSLTELLNCNYILMLDNTGKYIFYFINNKIYKTEENTLLELEIDVLQTYMFDYTLKESWVERQHVDRWDSNGNIIVNMIDENLDIGDYVINEKLPLYPITFNEIITSTTPLGTLGTNLPVLNPNDTANPFPDNLEQIPDWLDEDNDNNIIEYPPIDDEIHDGGGSGITPDPNLPFPNMDSHEVITDISGENIAYNLCTPGSNQIENFSYSYGEIMYSFINSYSLTCLDIYNTYKRGTMLKTKNGERLYLNWKDFLSNYSTTQTTIYALGNGNVPTNYPTLYGIAQNNWGKWILIKRNKSSGNQYIFISGIDCDYALNHNITISDIINNTGMVKIGNVNSSIDIEGEKLVYIQITTMDSSISSKYIESPLSFSKNIDNMNYGIGRYQLKQNILEYPNISIDTVPAYILGRDKIRCPVKNASQISIADVNIKEAGVSFYQVYTTSDNLADAPIVVAPLSGKIIYSGNAFNDELSPFYSHLYAKNTVLLQVDTNLYIEFSHLGTINVQVGDTLEAGAVIGTCEDSEISAVYKNASGTTSLIKNWLTSADVNKAKNGFIISMNFVYHIEDNWIKYPLIKSTGLTSQEYFSGILHAGESTDLMTAVAIDTTSQFLAINPEAFLSNLGSRIGINDNFPDINAYPVI